MSHLAKGFPCLRALWYYLEMNHNKGSLIYVDSVPVIYEYVRTGLGTSVVSPLSQRTEENLVAIPFDYPQPHYYGVHCMKTNEEAVRFCQIAETVARDKGKILL